MQNLPGWIGVLIALCVLLWNVRTARKAEGNADMEARMKPIFEAVNRLELGQESQSRTLTQLTREQIRMATELEEHKTSDKQQFTDVKSALQSMHQSIEDLPLRIVTLLRHGL